MEMEVVKQKNKFLQVLCHWIHTENLGNNPKDTSICSTLELLVPGVTEVP